MNLNKNLLLKEKHSKCKCKDLILAHYKLQVEGSVAKFESLLWIFMSILRNKLERTVRKVVAQSCQAR